MARQNLSRDFASALIVACTCLLSFSRTDAGGAPQRTQTKLVLSQKPFALESDPDFVCDGTVNGFLTLPQPVVGRHTIEGIWIRPDGTVQEHSQAPLEFSPPGRQTAKLWLSFSSGGILSSTGDEDTSGFNGDWTVLVKWDNQELIQEKFKVKC